MSAIPSYLQQAWRLSEKELDDVEVVVDLRDCITDPDLARASTASGSPRALRALPRGDRTPSSSHLSDELDIESVLRALTSEVTGVDEADDLFPSLQLHQLEAHRQEDPGLASSWLDGLSRRSSATSVHSEEEMSVTFPCSPSETASPQGEASTSPSQAEADFELQEEILQSVAEDQAFAQQVSGTIEAEPADVTEDMISVVDIGDEVIPLADESSVMGRSYSSPRPLETTVASLLRRLSLEQQVDESVASSIRGVLEVSELLAEVEASRLTEEEIHALPTFPYVPCKETQQCAICLDPFQETEEVTMLRCAHFFHTECVASWMHRAAKCPLCRAYVVE